MTISEKAAYLKGLMDGLKLDTDKPEGQMIAGLQGYGGTFNGHNGMWCMGRIHSETDGCGQWADDAFTAGLKLVGTCYAYLV